MNTVIQSNGEILTGKDWRKQQTYFTGLPFYSNIPRMDEMAGPLQMALSQGSGHQSFRALLVKFAQGLDDVHPFSYTEGVDNLIRDAQSIFSPDSSSVSAKNASRIWAFLSKFVLLDRFARTLGVTEVSQGICLPKQTLCRDDFAGACKLLDDMHPPTKIVRKFLKTWADRDQTWSRYSASAQLSGSDHRQEDAAGVALTLSRRLIAIMKAKKLLNIEAGLEIMALGVTIASENSGVFPESVNDVDDVLRRIWSTRLDQGQLADISLELQLLHSSLKNMIEFVFTVSPLLALSTTGWTRRISGAHLIRLFIALGNNRPEIIVRLEDQVLQAIIGISEGRSRGEIMEVLYSEVGKLEKDLADDEHALNWFNVASADAISSTPEPSAVASAPPSDINAPSTDDTSMRNILRDKFNGGLASPPETPHVPLPSSSSRLALPLPLERISALQPSNAMDSHASSPSPLQPSSAPDFVKPSDLVKSDNKCPEVAVASSPTSSALPLEPPPPLVKPSDAEDAMDAAEDGLAGGETNPLTEEAVSRLEDMTPLFLKPGSRRSSSSSLTTISQMAVDDKPRARVQSAVESEDSDSETDESDCENGEDGPVIGVGLEAESSDAGHDGDEATMEPTIADEPSDDDEDDPMNGVGLEAESSDAGRDGDEGTVEPKISDDPNDTKNRSQDAALAAQLAEVGLRRSARNKETPPVVTRVPLPTVVVMRKALVQKDRVLVLDGLADDKPKLSNVALAKLHPTMYGKITGWGSTIEAGAKPFCHVPVQIVRPGKVASTGDDTATLRKVEARIEAGFRDGLPPHLLPNASSLEYAPGSDQSRIFVSSYSDFSRLDAADIQGLLRQRAILVHGHQFDYNYGWNLPSLGRVYDVDKKVSVLVSSLVHPHKPDLRHHQGTLREFYQMSDPESDQRFPPLNAISLPGNRRNLFVPCQFGSVASHEVAQSRLPSVYETTFGIAELTSKMEWSLVGGKGAISPFHVDSDGFGTVIVVLEGTKYWILATRLGDDEGLTSVDSLGPDWHPYVVNDGDTIDRFRFEAVHLQKGDMLIMPPGVPHWVLSTSNAICVGRHFYASSTIRFSVVGIVHGFFLGGALTNEDHVETRTLLYQLLVFWSMRIDQTDVDGAHIPRLSSQEGFLDIVYLGIFVILSTAFDRRFYLKPPPTLVDEVQYAICSFFGLLRVFSLRFVIFLGGTAVAPSYIVDRILAEFAAAAVVFGRGVEGPFGEGNDGSAVGIPFARFQKNIKGILEESNPDLLPFFLGRVKADHKNFLWTGPEIQILPRTADLISVIRLTGGGELLDFPVCPIYCQEVEDESPASVPRVPKRHRPDAQPEDSEDMSDEQPKKRQH